MPGLAGAAFSSFNQCKASPTLRFSFPKSAMSHWSIEGGFCLCIQWYNGFGEFSLGRARKLKINALMFHKTLSASLLLCSAYFRTVFPTKQLSCFTLEVFSFSGRRRELWAQAPGWFVQQFRIPPNKGSSWMLKQVPSLNRVGRNFCSHDQAPPRNVAHKTGRRTSWALAQRFLCLPLLVYMTICFCNVNI